MARPKSKHRTVEIHKWPPELVRVADQRVSNFLLYLSWVNFDLRKAIISAYCQGVEDCAVSVARSNELKDAPFKLEPDCIDL